MPILSSAEQAFLLNQGVSENALRVIRGKYSLNDSCYPYIASFIQQTSEEIFKKVLYMHDDVPEFILANAQSPQILNQLIQYGISMYELKVSVWNLDTFRRLYRHYNDFVQISQETGIPFRRIYSYGMKRLMPAPATLLNKEMLEERDRAIFKWLCREFEISNTLFDSLDENKRAIVVDHSSGIYNLLSKSVICNNMRAVPLEELADFLALKPVLLRVMLIYACELQSFQRIGISWKAFLHFDDQIRIHLLENSWHVIQCIKQGITMDSITCLNAFQVKQLLDLCDERDLNNQEILAEIKDFIDTAHLKNSSAVIMGQVESQRIKMAKKQMPLAGLFQLNFEVREHILQFTGSEVMPESDKRQLILSQLTLH